MNVYHRKLYAFLRSVECIDWLNVDLSYIYNELKCLQPHLQELGDWWENGGGKLVASIGSSSDRINLSSTAPLEQINDIAIRHPISGQQRNITVSVFNQRLDISEIAVEEDVKKVFWWFWRYFPEKLAEQDPHNAFLIPTHRILPDCPLHGYQSTVSALTGAIFHDSAEPHPRSLSLARRGMSERQGEVSDKSSSPYLFLFTFSPVQEFIKASRKFLDFWAGSYLLHYYSALLCFETAKIYGPDAIITPSLWNQEIIDAFIFQDEELIISTLKSQYNNPAHNFNNNPQNQTFNTALTTAGFPNVITVLVPSQEKATELGKHLDKIIKERWLESSKKVRQAIKEKVRDLLNNKEKQSQILKKISGDFPNYEEEELRKELENFSQRGCWEWNQLWEAQINSTWETYFVGVPFGHPKESLEIDITNFEKNQHEWIDKQNKIVRAIKELPTNAEREAYTKLNVGTWWGSLQAHLGSAIQAIKNTRGWQIPVAPGERSTLSGYYSAVYPQFAYQKFQNGLGVPSESLRLFWQVMGVAFPGLFNGSEKLNAIELTKRMAWKSGGIAFQQDGNQDNENAISLGITLNPDDDDYEGLIRFPNLCSIAAAHYATHNPQKIQEYWNDLDTEIKNEFDSKSHDIFSSRTRRPFHVKRADTALKASTNYGKGYNGVMLSSKWLADDMNLKNQSEKALLRAVIDKTQKKHFGDNNPADWWVLVLGDGDGMGNYVNGRKLKTYQNYIIEDLVNREGIDNETWRLLLEETKKRMGPATHVGLNRALLDFSNRIVNYITEQRCCGKVIYSGGDDVMAALSLADLPKYLISLRSAWCGGIDPEGEFNSSGGYWQWNTENTNQTPRPNDIPLRPLFTMGEEARMSLGIVIAHKSVPLPTVLEKIWDAEKNGAKKLIGGKISDDKSTPDKDGLCFRVIYGSGNTLEAFMKGHLLEGWWNFIKESQKCENFDLSPVLYRLAEELPRHAEVTESDGLFQTVANVVLDSRNIELPEPVRNSLLEWLNNWEKWAWAAMNEARRREIEPDKKDKVQALGARPEDMAILLKFTAFWVSQNKW